MGGVAMQTHSAEDEIRAAVREAYGAVATGRQEGCCGGGTGCCGPTARASRQLGYSDDDLAAVPDGADLGLGCGNPQAIAGLMPGERVLDLGSGAGFDAFLAARQVGPTGSVIGVDMTPQMVDRARANAAKTALANVDFRLGQIEALPVTDELHRRHHVQLRDQPVAGQVRGVPRSVPRALARWTAGDLRHRRDRRSASGHRGGPGRLHGVHRWRRARRRSRTDDCRRRIHGRAHHRQRRHPVAHRRMEPRVWRIRCRGVGADRGRQASRLDAEACCDSILLDDCCPADAKSECCEQSPQASSCGCQAHASPR